MALRPHARLFLRGVRRFGDVCRSAGQRVSGDVGQDWVTEFTVEGLFDWMWK